MSSKNEVSVYIVSLERCKEKKEKVIIQLNFFLSKEGKTANYHEGGEFAAVDGNSETVFDDHGDLVPSPLWMNPYTRLQMTRGEFGCAASHVSAWEKIAKDSVHRPFSLVVEDDAFFDESSFSFEKIERAFQETKVDFLYLCRKNMKPSDQEESLYKSEDFEIVKPNYSYWTCCYALTRRGAKILLSQRDDLYKKNLFPVDEYIPYMYGAYFYSKSLIDRILVSPFATAAVDNEGDANENSDEGAVDVNTFRGHGALKAGSFSNLPVRPTPGTFQSSSTYFSDHIPLKYFSKNGKMYDSFLATVATDEKHDGLKQLQSTSLRYGFEPVVLGLGKEWRGGEMQSGAGGAHKIYYLDEFFKSSQKGLSLLNSPSASTTLFIFCDGYDVIVNENANVLKEKFFARFPKIHPETGAGEVIFAAESSCWPRKDWASKYPNPPPENEDSDVKFLNSGIFMGRVKDVANLVAKAKEMCTGESNDDQEIFTRLFLEGKNGIVLDYSCEFGFCLYGNPIKASIEDVDLQENALTIRSPGGVIRDANKKKVRPCFIHGNGPYISKTILNSIANYCAGGRYGCWNPTYSSRPIRLLDDDDLLDDLPNVAIVYDLYGGSTSFHPDLAMPSSKFLNEKVDQLVKGLCCGDGGYPRQKLIGYIVYDATTVKPSSELFSTSLLRDYHWIECEGGFQNELQRFKAISKALREASGDAGRFDYVLYMTHRAENFAHHPNSLRRVVSAVKATHARAVSPLLKPAGNNIGTNFWGELNHQTLFYKRSSDYIEIVEEKRTGLFNVPYAWHLLFVEKELFTNESLFTRDYQTNRGVDMAWCKNVTHFGGTFIKLLSPSFGEIGPYYEPSASKTSSSVATAAAATTPPPVPPPQTVTLYDFKTTREKWLDAYIHPEFKRNFKLGHELIPHVHLTSVFTKRFCDEMIAAALAHPDKWSDRGAEKHFDERLGAVEAHPTNDIHLKDFGLEEMWKYVVNDLIAQAVWNEYKYSTKGINLAFVVRYKPNKQAALRPHHDSSTYTTNVCLNTDFTGGGCRFVRSGATVCLKTPGLMLLHPGKFTHMHEGLQVSDGERFILVTFIN